MASTAPKSTFLAALLIAAALGETGVRAADPPRPLGEARQARQPGVAGRVVGGQSLPLAAAGVYAYQLVDLSLQKVKTDLEGRFLFQSLPAGLYKIIVHKAGFVPAVVEVARKTAETYQFVDVELELAREARPAPGAPGDDFWSVRAGIPSDVLREIERSEGRIEMAGLAADPAGNALAAEAFAGQFRTEMQAMTGVDQTAAAGGGQVSSGRLGIEGRLGQLKVGLEGHFSQVASPSDFGAGAAPAGVGQASAVRLDLGRGESSRVEISSFNNRLVTRDGQGPELPIDFEHYGLRWTQAVGENGRSEVSYQYTAESNYHRQAAFYPAAIPESSRTWRVEGSYTASLGDSSTLQTGIRYRERQIDLGSPGVYSAEPALSNLDLFGRGGVRVQPSVLLEYGLYSTLSDGSLAMTPRGGVVLQLGESWQLGGSVSRQVYKDEGRPERDFLPTLYGDGDLCEDGSDSCYELLLTRKSGEDDSLTVGAVRRTVGKTLRLYFSDDFFDRYESLYLVPGDELPEMRLSWKRRLSPELVATLESRVASGGGGTFSAGDGRSYENRVQYMVTSLDTKYQRTSTGIFVAFHHLDQQLAPLGAHSMSMAPRSEVERLQLMLTQDLNILLDLAADWAVHLNVEVSRGGDAATQAADEDELRRRFLGGIAVKF